MEDKTVPNGPSESRSTGSPTGELNDLGLLRSYLAAGLATPGVHLELIDACLPSAPNRVACVYRRESGNIVTEIFDVVWEDDEWKVVVVENFCERSNSHGNSQRDRSTGS